MLLALTAFSLWLARGTLLTWLGALLVENDGPQKADAAVVLGGDDFGTRVITAGKLVRAGCAPYVLVSGPPSLLGHESDMTIEYARRHGFPASIFRPFTHELNSTRSETAAIGAYLHQNHVHKILLVTSNFHTRRAAKLMRSQVADVQTVVIAAPDPFFSPGNWWKTRSGQKTFLYEWMKTIATEFGV